MLHEVLIVLAGHESPFVTRHPNSIAVKEGLLHKAEQALLVQVAVLGQIHSDVVKRIEWVQQLTHKKSDQDDNQWITGPFPPSSHAVASSIDTGLVRPFMAKIVELEKRILARDSSFVGGDRVVSLSAIVAETVQRWERRFRYAQTLLGSLITGIKPKICHEVLERLENDRVTGYEDVKQLVMLCISAVQRTWLQQLGCWVLYGRLPRYTEGDFMIDKHSTNSSSQKTILYELIDSRIPPMCTHSAAADIYAIGNSLAQLQTDGAEHEPLLKTIELPIKESQLTSVMAQIKSHVFRGIVSTRLPIVQIRKLLATLVSIPLLGEPDFAVSVIETMLIDRPALAKSPRAPHDRFRQALEAFLEDLPVDVKMSEKFSLLHSNGLSLGYFSVKDAHQVSKPDRFDDMLVGVRCKLVLRLEWPLSLLVPETDSQRYTFAFSYLIALRSVNYRVASLWRCHLSLDHSDSKIWSLAHRAKMVLDILWDHAHTTVISPLYHDKLEPVLAPHNGVIDPQVIIAAHADFLSDVCHMLLIDSEAVRTALRSVFIGCTVLVERLTSHRLSDYEPTELMSQISMLIDTIESEPESDPKINLLLLKLECLKS